MGLLEQLKFILEQLFCKHDFQFGYAKGGLGFVCKKCGKEKRTKVFKYNADGKDWWREDYFNHAGIEGEIKSKVSEFLDYLEGDKEAKELYFNNWISK